jgi:hypothetical protein
MGPKGKPGRGSRTRFQNINLALKKRIAAGHHLDLTVGTLVAAFCDQKNGSRERGKNLFLIISMNSIQHPRRKTTLGLSIY